MKALRTLTVIVCAAALFAPQWLQAQNAADGDFKQEGIASWYGPEFDGRPTASGEIFDSTQLTAAHPSLPFGTVITVTNKHNNKSVAVRVNDRGPFVSARIVDVSKAAAEKLDMLSTGTAPVLLEVSNELAVPVLATPQQPVVTSGRSWSVDQPTPEPTPVTQIAPVQQAPVAVTTSPTQPAPVAQPIQEQPQVTAPLRQASVVLVPAIVPAPNKVYRLQVGSYKAARNAVDSFDKLKSVGLNPAYERYEENFRVVLSGVSGADVAAVSERISAAGFREVLIREEH